MSRVAVLFLFGIGVSSFVATYNTLSMLYGSRPASSTLNQSQSRPGRPFFSMGAASGSNPVVKRPGNFVRRPKIRRPFHTAMTCDDSPYVKWQSRIMYYYYKMYKDEPESEMGGFTRVLHSGYPDSLMNEIPTFVVDPLPPGMDKGYVVLNRPWAFVQWLKRATIQEEYIWMAEPDHLILRPIPNLATEHQPAAFPFFYIAPREHEKLLRRWYPKDKGPITDIDPVGNSPVIIKKTDLIKIAPLWHNISLEFKQSKEVDKAFGWVLEMYGYATAAALQGHTHILRKDWMAQPPYDVKVGNFFLIHYTYGCDYDRKGKFTPGKVGFWHFDKRDHQTALPQNLSYPPKGAAPAVVELIRRLNDATSSIPGWKAGAT